MSKNMFDPIREDPENGDSIWYAFRWSLQQMFRKPDKLKEWMTQKDKHNPENDDQK